jgi:hypothetical protein
MTRSLQAPLTLSNATSPPPPQERLYFVNAPVDWLAMGGLSILCWLLLRGVHSGERSDLVISLGVQLAWFVNWPHFAATNYRLYQSPAHIAQYPKTAKLLPWLIIAGIGFALWSPEGFAPWWVKVFLIWSPYHFSGQTFGMTMLYARRSGWQVGPWLRRGMKAFIYGTFLIGTLGAETWEGGGQWYGVAYPSLGLPAWTVQAATWLMYGGLALVVLSFGAQIRASRRGPALIILLPATAQYVWFVTGSSWASFAEFVPLFHSLQYLLVAWSMQLQQGHLERGEAGAVYVRSSTLRWLSVNFAGGAALFFVIPHLVSAAMGTSLFFATAAVIAGVQLHHFIVDGVIWKLRRQTVRSPLMGTLADVMAGRQYDQTPPVQ